MHPWNLSEPVHVEPWPDPLLEHHGFEVRHPYVEEFWLAILGPTATWLMRRLAAHLDGHPEGGPVDLQALAAGIGVGHRNGRHAPFLRTLERCARFGLVQATPQGLRVRRHLPPLTQSQVARLPEDLRQRHVAVVDRASAPAPAPAVSSPEPAERVERARGAALALIERGLAPHVAERELHRDGTHPALAHAAVRWALEQRGLVAAEEPMPPAA